MCGRATFTTVVSSTSMNVAAITAAAISHGLARGFHSESDRGAASTTVSLMGKTAGGNRSVRGQEYYRESFPIQRVPRRARTKCGTDYKRFWSVRVFLDGSAKKSFDCRDSAPSGAK